MLGLFFMLGAALPRLRVIAGKRPQHWRELRP